MKDDDFQRKLLATFHLEAREQIESIASGLLDLEKGLPAEAEGRLVEEIFRSAHNLKGAARSVHAPQIESVCHELESLFSAMKRHQLPLSTATFDALQRAVDLLRTLLADPQANSPSPEVSQTTNRLRSLLDRGVAQEGLSPLLAMQEIPVLPLEEKTMLPETLRVPIGKLNTLLFQVEEMLASKLSGAQHQAELEQLRGRCRVWEMEWRRIRAGLRRLRRGFETGPSGATRTTRKGEVDSLRKFLEWNRDFWERLEHDLAQVVRSNEQHQSLLGSMVDNLLESTKELLVLPFSQLLQTFPGMVRDLSSQQGKEIELVLRGVEVEIDRRILEEMKDAFIHLVRNSIDHGIERAEERERRGKPRRAQIVISAVQKTGDQIEITVLDDGGGMDMEKIKRAALDGGLVTPEQAENLSKGQILSLVFESGFSTSPVVTDFSGRGLGLAIVREKVEKFGGTVYLDSEKGAGTTFAFNLPATLARFRGVIVRVQEQLFILPSTNVEQVARVQKEEIKTVENRETICWNLQPLSLVPLGALLGLSARVGAEEETEYLPVLIVSSRHRRIAFRVDEVLHEQEILMKPLGPQLQRLRHFSGATILGNGQLLPILNVSDLFVSAGQWAGALAIVPLQPAAKARRKSVLVAEDSITSRALLRNILQAAGYEVEVAVDGIDALTQLKSKDFDLLVSDVDMPRLNGFGLTEKIRGEKKLSHLPVVLITALGTQEDKERGIEAGANAYLVKSRFDQRNLLEILRRLL